jgi:hypothetical protein
MVTLLHVVGSVSRETFLQAQTALKFHVKH